MKTNFLKHALNQNNPFKDVFIRVFMSRRRRKSSNYLAECRIGEEFRLRNQNGVMIGDIRIEEISYDEEGPYAFLELREESEKYRRETISSGEMFYLSNHSLKVSEIIIGNHGKRKINIRSESRLNKERIFSNENPLLNGLRH